MCGRYALALPPWRVRQMIQASNMPTDDTPDDDQARQSYNFAPGYYGLVYREDVPDHGAAGSSQHNPSTEQHNDEDQELGISHSYTQSGAPDTPTEESQLERKQGTSSRVLHSVEATEESAVDGHTLHPPTSAPHYKLQAMAWGLTPFWTKRRPDYATIMRTINCRDDSLARSGGMWHTMKQGKRCIVLAQGFFEWLKKNEGKDKIPHFIKRKDGQLMCFAGLWDCVKYEDRDDKHYSYTIITTDANKQISFLHDRMPVIFENGSREMFTWLDSHRSQWSAELQSLLKPYTGELEIYPVTKDMNKAGTSSPNFIIPIDSSKQSISHFFGKKPHSNSTSPLKPSSQSEQDKPNTSLEKIKQESPDPSDHQDTYRPGNDDDGVVPEGINNETNAPLPATPSVKRLRDTTDTKASPKLEVNATFNDSEPKQKAQKVTSTQASPSKQPTTPMSSKKSKNATSNTAVATAGSPNANQKITSFFKK